MTIEERIEALERGLSVARRRNRYLLVGLVVLAIGWIFTSTAGTVQAQAGDNIIRAEGFELVDAQGNVLAALLVNEFVAGLYLYDENRTVRAGLAVSDEFGPGLVLADENGTCLAILGVLDEYGHGLVLADENGTCRAVLSVSDTGPKLGLFDENGTPRAALGANDEFGSLLVLYDENRRSIWAAP